MSSSVFYRFKSQKEPSRVSFDGTGISVFELKREIITQSKLGDGTDFELIVSAEDSNEVYDDDTSIIPRSSSVIAKRLPATRPGRGGAARYVSGKMPQNARSSYRQEPIANQANHGASVGLTAMNGARDEEERIAAMLQMGADDWAQQSQQLASVAPIHRSGPAKNKPHGEVNRPLPQGYVCNRCGEKGHWIWDCPTNNDPAYDNRPRIKRTTGIPKSFLKTIEKPTAAVTDGTTEDQRQPTGVMVNSDGEWVVAEPDQAAWDKYQAQTKTSAAAQDAAVQDSDELRDLGLECKIDKRLFVDPTKTPCCGTTYCHECIQNALLDNDLRCPQCQTENVPIDDLVPDDEAQVKVRHYQESKAQSEKEVDKSDDKADKSPSRQNELSLPEASARIEAPTGPLHVPRSPPAHAGRAKKRAAEVELESDRKAKSPKPTLAPMAQRGSAQKHSNDQSFSQAMKGPDPTALNSMTMGSMNSFTNLGMPFNMGLPNPMMMAGAPFLAPGWNNNSWAMGQNPYLFAGVQQQMGYSQNHGIQAPGNQMNGQAVSMRFANQQRSHNESDSAYFRQPVNPHRQKKNWNQNRQADYREI